MKLPAGMTEASVLDEMEQAIYMVHKSLVIPGYEGDDGKQFCRLTMLELLEKESYNGSIPLRMYFARHLKHRLANLYRDRVRRTSDSPCQRCHSAEPCTPGGCDLYRKWYLRNEKKASLACTSSHDPFRDDDELADDSDPVVEDVELREIEILIDEHLPVSLRADYLRMRAREHARDAGHVPKARRQKVEAAVRQILNTGRYVPPAA